MYSSSSLWGGRFQEQIASTALEYTESLAVDAAMLTEDVWGSKAHVIMLNAGGIIDDEDARAILSGLGSASREIDEHTFAMDVADEDVHMNVERYVTSRHGKRGARMHTARSRNDQVVTDTRMHTRTLVLGVEQELIALQETLLALATDHADTLTMGYTHTQHAQPITIGYWATAYVSMFRRDLTRLSQAYRSTDINPLGACALAGTSFPTDRRLTTELLGFAAVQENGLDAVSSRDFGLEFLAALAIMVSNTSKMAEEIVYWSTHEFRLVEVADGYAMGSSIMPQKKNPCVAELIRGKTGKVYGRLVELLTTMKGIPTGYNRDLQEDKPPIWEAAASALSTVRTLNGLLSTLRFNEDRMRELAHKNFALATEVADYLVKTQNIPFRECHRIVGEAVGTLYRSGRTFEDVQATVDALAAAGATVTERELAPVLDPVVSVNSHTSLGGTAPAEVLRMVKAERDWLEAHKQTFDERQERIESAFRRTEAVSAAVIAGSSVHDALHSLGGNHHG
ncbi:argininosuccinate lyase [Dactylosporangium sp. CS-033363]|uniref:argininosuccinate lyase n=1 Tax=Dactylosporangium sp. CS-033363 TaxID=3239935 RepID=UPI003D91D8A4